MSETDTQDVILSGFNWRCALKMNPLAVFLKSGKLDRIRMLPVRLQFEMFCIPQVSSLVLIQKLKCGGTVTVDTVSFLGPLCHFQYHELAEVLLIFR